MGFPPLLHKCYAKKCPSDVFFPFHLSAVYWLAILLYFYGPYGLINSDAYAFFKIELLVVWCCLGVSRDLGIIPLGQGHQIALLASLDKLQRK